MICMYQRLTVAHLVKCVQAVVKPFKVFGGTRRVWYKVLVAWLVAAVLAIPKPLSFVQTEHQQQVRRSSSEDHTQTVTVYRCESAGYTAEWQRKLYFTFMISVVFIIPPLTPPPLYIPALHPLPFGFLLVNKAL